LFVLKFVQSKQVSDRFKLSIVKTRAGYFMTSAIQRGQIMQRWQMDMNTMVKQAEMLKQITGSVTVPKSLGFYRKRRMLGKHQRQRALRPPDEWRGGRAQDMRANLSFREYLEANACLFSNDSPRYVGF
jgi:hypothetical protein